MKGLSPEGRPLRIALAAIAFVLVACTGAQGSPSASVPASAGDGSTNPPRSPSPPVSSPLPSGSAAASASPVERDTAVAEGWIQTADFGGETTIEAVHAVAEAPFGVIAAGVQLSTRNLNVFGPLPGGGRVWLSADGSSWEDVTPPGIFDGASLNQLIVMPDGAVLALGLGERLVDGFPTERPIVWETMNGVSWEEVSVTVGDDPVSDVAAGPRGYLARGWVELGLEQLWHSTDGRTYAAVADPTNGRIVTGTAAGPEGFVIRADIYESADPTAVYASANGTDWYAATSDGWDPWDVAPLKADWIALDSPVYGASEDGKLRTWFSANGLDWTEAGWLPVRAVPVGGDAVCTEFPRLVSTGSLVVASATLSYPCGEGRVERFGSASITSDGVTWSSLPFAATSDPADGSTRGTQVRAGLDLESGTVLVGEKAFRATFWFRPSD